MFIDVHYCLCMFINVYLIMFIYLCFHLMLLHEFSGLLLVQTYPAGDLPPVFVNLGSWCAIAVCRFVLWMYPANTLTFLFTVDPVIRGLTRLHFATVHFPGHRVGPRFTLHQRRSHGHSKSSILKESARRGDQKQLDFMGSWMIGLRTYASKRYK